MISKFELNKTYINTETVGNIEYKRYLTVEYLFGKTHIGGILVSKAFRDGEEVYSCTNAVCTKICKVNNEDRQKTTDLLYTFYSNN